MNDSVTAGIQISKWSYTRAFWTGHELLFWAAMLVKSDQFGEHELSSEKCVLPIAFKKGTKFHHIDRRSHDL